MYATSEYGSDQTYQIRVSKLQLPLYVGYVLIPASIINIIIGIVTLVFLDNYQYPLPTGYQLWTGILGIAIGALGIRLGTTGEDMRQDVSPEFRKKFYGFFWASNVVNWSATQGFGYSIANTVICAVQGCSDNKNELLIALHAISIVLTTAICIGGFIGQYFFYKFRRTYGILSNKEIQQQNITNIDTKS